MDLKKISEELAHLYNTYNEMHDEFNEKVVNHNQDVSQFWEINHIRANSMRGKSVQNPHIPDLKPMSKKDIEIQWLYSHIDEYNDTFRDAPIEDIETHVGLRADAYGFVAQCFIEIDTKVKIRYKKFLELKNKLFEAAGDKYQGVAPKKVNDLENQLKKNIDENKWYISAAITSFRSCILFAATKGVKLDYSENKNLVDKDFLEILNSDNS